MLSLDVFLYVNSCTLFPASDSYVKIFDDTGNTKRPLLQHMQEVMLADAATGSSGNSSVTASIDRTLQQQTPFSATAAAVVAALGPDSGSLATTLHRIVHPASIPNSSVSPTPRSALLRRSGEAIMYDELDKHRRRESGEDDELWGVEHFGDGSMVTPSGLRAKAPSSISPLLGQTSKRRNEPAPCWNEAFPITMNVPIEALIAGCALKLTYDLRHHKHLLPQTATTGASKKKSLVAMADAAVDQVVARLVYLCILKKVREKSLLKTLQQLHHAGDEDQNSKASSSSTMQTVPKATLSSSPTTVNKGEESHHSETSSTGTGSRFRALREALPSVLRLTCFDYRKGLDVFSGETMITSLDIFGTPPLRPLHIASQSRMNASTPNHPDTPQQQLGNRGGGGSFSWGTTRRAARRLQLASDALVAEMAADVQTAGDISREGFSEDLADQLEGYFRERLHKLYIASKPSYSGSNSGVTSQPSTSEEDLENSGTESTSSSSSSSTLDSNTERSFNMKHDESLRGIPFFEECGGLRVFSAHPSHHVHQVKKNSTGELELTDSARQYISHHITSLSRFVLGLVERQLPATNGEPNSRKPTHAPAHMPVVANDSMRSATTSEERSPGTGTSATVDGVTKAGSTRPISSRKLLVIWKYLFLDEFLALPSDVQNVMHKSAIAFDADVRGSFRSGISSSTRDGSSPALSPGVAPSMTSPPPSPLSLFRVAEEKLRAKRVLPIVNGMAGSKLLCFVGPNAASCRVQQEATHQYGQRTTAAITPFHLQIERSPSPVRGASAAGDGALEAPQQPPRVTSFKAEQDDKTSGGSSTNSATFIQHSPSSMSATMLRREQQLIDDGLAAAKASAKPYGLPVRDLLKAQFSDESSSLSNTRNTTLSAGHFGGGVPEEQLRRELESIEYANFAASEQLLESSLSTPLGVGHGENSFGRGFGETPLSTATEAVLGTNRFGAANVQPPHQHPPHVKQESTSSGPYPPFSGSSSSSTRRPQQPVRAGDSHSGPFQLNPPFFQSRIIVDDVGQNTIAVERMEEILSACFEVFPRYLSLWTGSPTAPHALLPLVCQWLAQYASVFNSIDGSVWNLVLPTLTAKKHPHLTESLLLTHTTINKASTGDEEAFLGCLLMISSLSNPSLHTDGQSAASPDTILQYARSPRGRLALSLTMGAWMTTSVHRRYESLGGLEWDPNRASVLGGCTLPAFLRMWLLPQYVRTQLCFRVATIVQCPKSHFLLHVGGFVVDFSHGLEASTSNTAARGSQSANLLAQDDAEEELSLSSQGYRLVKRDRLWKLVLSRIALQDEEGNLVDSVSPQKQSNDPNGQHQPGKFLVTSTSYIPPRTDEQSKSPNSSIHIADNSVTTGHQEVVRFDDTFYVPATELFSASILNHWAKSDGVPREEMDGSSMRYHIRRAFQEANEGGVGSTVKARLETFFGEQEALERADHDAVQLSTDAASLEVLLFCETRSTYSLVRGRRGQIQRIPSTPNAAVGNKPVIIQSRATLAGCGFTFITQKTLLEMALCPTAPEFESSLSQSPLFHFACQEASEAKGVDDCRMPARPSLSGSAQPALLGGGVAGRQEVQLTLYSPEVVDHGGGAHPNTHHRHTVHSGTLAVRQVAAGNRQRGVGGNNFSGVGVRRKRDLVASAPSFVNPRTPFADIVLTAYHSNLIPVNTFKLSQARIRSKATAPLFSGPPNPSVDVSSATMSSRMLPGLSVSRSAVLAAPHVRRFRVLGSSSGDVHCTVSLRVGKLILYRTSVEGLDAPPLLPTPSCHFQDTTVSISSANSATRSMRVLFALDDLSPRKELEELRQVVVEETMAAMASKSASPTETADFPTSWTYAPASHLRTLDMSTTMSLTPSSRVAVVAVSVTNISISQDTIASAHRQSDEQGTLKSGQAGEDLLAAAESVFGSEISTNNLQNGYRMQPYLTPNADNSTDATIVGLAEFNPYDLCHAGNLWVPLMDGTVEIGLVYLSWSSVFHFIVSPLGHLYPPTPIRRWDSLELNIIEAKGLTRAAFGGLADPFCAVQLLPLHLNLSPLFTSTARSTLSPKWNASMFLEIPPNEASGFLIVVLDEDVSTASGNSVDKLSSSRFIGSCAVHCDAPLWQLEEGTMWLPLIPAVLGSNHLGKPVKISAALPSRSLLSVLSADQQQRRLAYPRGAAGLTELTEQLLSTVGDEGEEQSSNAMGTPRDPLAFPSSDDSDNDIRSRDERDSPSAVNPEQSQGAFASAKKRVSFGGESNLHGGGMHEREGQKKSVLKLPQLHGPLAIRRKQKSGNDGLSITRVPNGASEKVATGTDGSVSPVLSTQGMVRIRWRFHTADPQDVPHDSGAIPSSGMKTHIQQQPLGTTAHRTVSSLPHPMPNGDSAENSGSTVTGGAGGGLTLFGEMPSYGSKVVCSGLHVNGLPMLMMSSTVNPGNSEQRGTSRRTPSVSNPGTPTTAGGMTLADLMVSEVKGTYMYGSGVFASNDASFGAGFHADIEKDTVGRDTGNPLEVPLSKAISVSSASEFHNSDLDANGLFQVRVFPFDKDTAPPPLLSTIQQDCTSSSSGDVIHPGVFKQVMEDGNDGDTQDDNTTASAAFGNALRGASDGRIVAAFSGYLETFPANPAAALIVEIYRIVPPHDDDHSSQLMSLVGVGSATLKDARFSHGEAFATAAIYTATREEHNSPSTQPSLTSVEDYLSRYYTLPLRPQQEGHKWQASGTQAGSYANDLAALRSTTFDANMEDLLKAVTSPQIRGVEMVEHDAHSGRDVSHRLNFNKSSTSVTATLRLQLKLDGPVASIEERTVTDMLSLTTLERRRRQLQAAHNNGKLSHHFDAPAKPLSAENYNTLWNALLDEADQRAMQTPASSTALISDNAPLKWTAPLLPASGFMKLTPLMIRGLDFRGMLVVEGVAGDKSILFSSAVASAPRCDVVLPESDDFPITVLPPSPSNSDAVDVYPRVAFKVYQGGAASSPFVATTTAAHLHQKSVLDNVQSLRRSMMVLNAKAHQTSALGHPAVGPGLAAKRRALRCRFLASTDLSPVVPRPTPAQSQPSIAPTSSDTARNLPPKRELLCTGVMHLCDVDSNRGTAWIRLCSDTSIIAALQVRFEHNFLPNAIAIEREANGDSTNDYNTPRLSIEDRVEGCAIVASTTNEFVGEVAVTVRQLRGLPRSTIDGNAPRAICVIGLKQDYDTPCPPTSRHPSPATNRTFNSSFTTAPCEQSCNPSVESGGVFPLTASGIGGSASLRLQVIDATTSSVIGTAVDESLVIHRLWESGRAEPPTSDSNNDKFVLQSVWVPLQIATLHNPAHHPPSRRIFAEAQLSVRIRLRTGDAGSPFLPLHKLKAQSAIWDSLFEVASPRLLGAPTPLLSATTQPDPNDTLHKVIAAGGVFADRLPGTWSLDDVCINVTVLSGGFRRPLGDRLFVALQTTSQSCPDEALQALKRNAEETPKSLLGASGAASPFLIPAVIGVTSQLRSSTSPHWSEVFGLNLSAISKLSRLHQQFMKTTVHAETTSLPPKFNGTLYLVIYAMQGTSFERMETGFGGTSTVAARDSRIEKPRVEAVAITVLNAFSALESDSLVAHDEVSPEGAGSIRRTVNGDDVVALQVVTFADFQKGEPSTAMSTTSAATQNTLFVALDLVKSIHPKKSSVQLFVKPASFIPITSYASSLLASTAEGQTGNRAQQTVLKLRFGLSANYSVTEEITIGGVTGGHFSPPSLITLNSPGNVVTVDLVEFSLAASCSPSNASTTVIATGSFVVPNSSSTFATERKNLIDTTVTLYDVLSLKDGGRPPADNNFHSVPLARLVVLLDSQPLGHFSDSGTTEVLGLQGLSIAPAPDPVNVRASANSLVATPQVSNECSLHSAMSSGALTIWLRVLDSGDGRCLVERQLEHLDDDDDRPENDIWIPSGKSLASAIDGGNFLFDGALITAGSVANSTHRTPMILTLTDFCSRRASVQVIARWHRQIAINVPSETLLAEASGVVDLFVPSSGNETTNAENVALKIPLVGETESTVIGFNERHLTLHIRRTHVGNSSSRTESTKRGAVGVHRVPLTVVSLTHSGYDSQDAIGIQGSTALTTVSFSNERSLTASGGKSVVAAPMIIASSAGVETSLTTCLTRTGDATNVVLRTVVFQTPKFADAQPVDSNMLTLYSQLSMSDSVFVGSVRAEDLRNALQGVSNHHYPLPLWNGGVRTAYSAMVFKHSPVSENFGVNSGEGDISPADISSTSPEYFPAKGGLLESRVRFNLHVLEAKRAEGDDSSLNVNSMSVEFSGGSSPVEVFTVGGEGSTNALPTYRPNANSFSAVYFRSEMLTAVVTLRVATSGVSSTLNVPLVSLLVESGLRGSTWLEGSNGVCLLLTFMFTSQLSAVPIQRAGVGGGPLAIEEKPSMSMSLGDAALNNIRRLQYTLLGIRAGNIGGRAASPTAQSAESSGDPVAHLVITSIEGLMFDPIPSIAGRFVLEPEQGDTSGVDGNHRRPKRKLAEFVVTVHDLASPEGAARAPSTMDLLNSAISQLQYLEQQRIRSSSMETNYVLNRLEEEENRYRRTVHNLLAITGKSSRAASSTGKTNGASSPGHKSVDTFDHELIKEGFVARSVSGFVLTQDGDIQTEGEFLDHPRKCTVVFLEPLRMPLELLSATSCPRVSVWRKEVASASAEVGYVFMGQGEVHAMTAFAAAAWGHHGATASRASPHFPESQAWLGSVLAAAAKGQTSENGLLMRVVAPLLPRHSEPAHKENDLRRIRSRVSIASSLVGACTEATQSTSVDTPTPPTAQKSTHSQHRDSVRNAIFGILQGFIVCGGQTATALTSAMVPDQVAPFPFETVVGMMSHFCHSKCDPSAYVRKSAKFYKRVGNGANAKLPVSAIEAAGRAFAMVAQACQLSDSSRADIPPLMLLTSRIHLPLPPVVFLVVIPTSITIATQRSGFSRGGLELSVMCRTAASIAPLRPATASTSEAASLLGSESYETAFPLVLGPIPLTMIHRHESITSGRPTKCDKNLQVTSAGNTTNDDHQEESSVTSSSSGDDAELEDDEPFEQRHRREQYQSCQAIFQQLGGGDSRRGRNASLEKGASISIYVSLLDATHKVVVASSSAVQLSPFASTANPHSHPTPTVRAARSSAKNTQAEGCFAHSGIKIALVGDLVSMGGDDGRSARSTGNEGVVVHLTMDVLVTKNHPSATSYAQSCIRYLEQRNHGTALSELAILPQRLHQPAVGLHSRDSTTRESNPSRIQGLMQSSVNPNNHGQGEISTSEEAPISTTALVPRGRTGVPSIGGASSVSWGVRNQFAHYPSNVEHLRDEIATPERWAPRSNFTVQKELPPTRHHVVVYEPSPPRDDTSLRHVGVVATSTPPPKRSFARALGVRPATPPPPSDPISNNFTSSDNVAPSPPNATHLPLPVAFFGAGCAYHGKVFMFGGFSPATGASKTLSHHAQLRDPYSAHHYLTRRTSSSLHPVRGLSVTDLGAHVDEHENVTNTLPLSPMDRVPEKYFGLTNQLKSFDPCSNEWRDELLEREQASWKELSVGERQNHLRHGSEQTYLEGGGDKHTLRRPPPRYRHSCVAYNDALYIFGGWGIDPDNAFDVALTGVQGRYETLKGVFEVTTSAGDSSDLVKDTSSALPRNPHAGLLDTTWRFDLIHQEWCELRTQHFADSGSNESTIAAGDPDVDFSVPISCTPDTTGTKTAASVLRGITSRSRQGRGSERSAVREGSGGAQDFRTDHVAFVLDSLMIVHGGWKVEVVETIEPASTNESALAPKDTHRLHAKYSRRSDMAALDLMTGTWSAVPVADASVALPLTNHTACIVQSRVYIFGGVGAVGAPSVGQPTEICNATVYTLDTSSDAGGVRWEPVIHAGSRKTSVAPVGRFGHCMASAQGTSVCPSALSSEAATQSDQSATFFIFGGVLVANEGGSSQVWDHSSYAWEFDVITRIWRRYETLPGPQPPLRATSKSERRPQALVGVPAVGGCAAVVSFGLTSHATLVFAGGLNCEVATTEAGVRAMLEPPPASCLEPSAAASSTTMVALPSTASSRFLQRHAPRVMHSNFIRTPGHKLIDNESSSTSSRYGLTSPTSGSSSSGLSPATGGTPRVAEDGCAVGYSMLA